jgi:hypothetical protein
VAITDSTSSRVGVTPSTTSGRSSNTGLSCGKVPLARTAMRTHLRAVFNDIERIRASAPEPFADPSTVPVRRNVVVWE